MPILLHCANYLGPHERTMQYESARNKAIARHYLKARRCYAEHLMQRCATAWNLIITLVVLLCDPMTPFP